jgi:dienelactone hydrolase
MRPSSLLGVLALTTAFACTCRSRPAVDDERSERQSKQLDSAVRDPLRPELVEFASDGRMLYGYLYRPSGRGPFPAVVFNHGSEPRPGPKRPQSWFYVTRGFALFVPHRRGHGESQNSGDYIVDRWNRAARDPEVLVNELDAHLDDVMAAVAYLRDQTFVDPERIAVAGCSFGGILSLLAAERGEGIAAAIDFAGASYVWDRTPPLQERMKRAARNAKVPVFFLQAENDADTTPSKVLYEELGATKQRSRMRIFPPHGTTVMEGHAFCLGSDLPPWGDDVLAFLQETLRMQ